MMKAASYDKIEKLRPWRDWKTCQPGFARWKCTPIPACGGTSPGGGSLLYASLSANLSRSLFNGGKSSPFGGKVVRQHQKGCISPPAGRFACFPSPARAVVRFSLPKAAYILIARQGDTSTLSGEADVKPPNLRGVSPVNLKNLFLSCVQEYSRPPP